MEPGVRAGVRHARGGVTHALVRVRVRVRVWARLRVRARATLGVMLAFTLTQPLLPNRGGDRWRACCRMRAGVNPA